MTLLERIDSEYVQAYKARDEVRLLVLRSLKTAMKNKQVELKRPLEEGEILDLVAKEVKQRKDSIEQFDKAGRDDLSSKERKELEALQDYLPSQLSSEELEQAVDKAIADAGANSMKDMGSVMQAIMKDYKGRVDGKELSGLVRSKLA